MPAHEFALRRPAQTEGAVAAAHPLPIDTGVEPVSQRADFGFVAALAGEILPCGQNTGDQQAGVEAGQLAAAGALAGLHVEEVVVEALITGGVARLALNAVSEKMQRRQHALDCLRTGDEAALDPDRIGCQRHTDGGDAAG